MMIVKILKPFSPFKSWEGTKGNEATCPPYLFMDSVPNVQVHMAVSGNESSEEWMKHLCSQINFGEMKARCLRQGNTDYSSGLLDVVQANVSATLLAALALSPHWFELSSWPSAENQKGGKQSLTLAKAKCSPQFHHHLWSIILCRSPYVGATIWSHLKRGPTLSEEKKKVHILLHTAETQKLFVA